MNNLIGIAVTEAKIALEKHADDTLEDQFRAAARSTFRHWMVTDEQQQFMAACEALYAVASAEDKERIKSELESLRDLAALLSGVPVDLERMSERQEDAPEPIGLRGLWIEVTQHGG